MSRMASLFRTTSLVVLMGLGANSAWAQSPVEFINDASAKGMADIETSRMAHGKAESRRSRTTPSW